MSVPVRSVAGFLALLAVGCAGTLAAQAAPEGRAWTDPPVRGSALAPDTAPAAAPKSEPRTEAAAPRAGAPEPKAVASKHRVAAVRPRLIEPRIVAVRPVAVARAHPAPPPPRIAVVRPRTPAPRPVRYGFLAPPPPPGMLYVKSRAGRIRQAEAAGYLVVRRSTFAAPDGRVLYGYRPYDADE